MISALGESRQVERMVNTQWSHLKQKDLGWAHTKDLKKRLEEAEGVSHVDGKAEEPAYCFPGL